MQGHSNKRSATAISVFLVSSLWLPAVVAHDHLRAELPTFQITAPSQEIPDPKLIIHVTEAASGHPTAARFTLVVDGEPYVPDVLNGDGLRFVSIHQRKKQQQVITYTRGTGPVELPLPAGAKRVMVHLAKGFEYLPQATAVELGSPSQASIVRVRMTRWANLAEHGWVGCDEHLHYERRSQSLDADWLTMMAADDLVYTHFMVLKGANIAGIWADQFAYGPQGEASDGKRLIRPGEEYRDPAQGHINLLGIHKIIEPISTGGLGEPMVPYNFPPLHDVYLTARRLGGVGGVAHGAGFPAAYTAIVDTVLGALDFFEISNTHLFKTDVWYRLMNCGYLVPPAAGTDLPNFPYRDAWQPFLGEVRMYLKTGADRDFESWKAALRQGEVFVTSGPLLQFSVDGAGPGGTVQLPAGGGNVLLHAELSSPLALDSLQIIRNGRPLPLEVEASPASGEKPVYRLRIDHSWKIQDSCWIAARGVGVPKKSLAENLNIEQKTIAHTAAVRVLVGDRPIWSAEDAKALTGKLIEQQDFYRTQGKYEKPEHRQYVLALFDKAIAALKRKP